MPRRKKAEFPATEPARPLDAALKAAAEKAGMVTADALPVLRDLGPPEIPLGPLPRTDPDLVGAEGPRLLAPTGEEPFADADMGWAAKIRPFHQNNRGLMKGEAEAIFLKDPGLNEAQAESLGHAGFKLTEDQQYWVAPATAARRLIADLVARQLDGQTEQYYRGVR
ncbi:MAG: hypothetical protein U0835_00555 [Isosphaeraceae bacterium]